MDFKDCIEFANAVQGSFVATVDGDQPRVRGFLLWFADETGFYYHTGATKQVCQQLMKNPKIEVCLFAPDPAGAGKMMRIAGKVEFLDDIELKTRLLEERPFLKEIGSGTPDDPNLAVFRIAEGEAHFWTMEDNTKEAEIPRIKFP